MPSGQWADSEGMANGMTANRRLRRWIAAVGVALALPLLAVVGGCWVVTNPVAVTPDPVPAPSADPARLAADVRYLAAIGPARNSSNVAALDHAANYIGNGFAEAGCNTSRETFEVERRTYANVICSFGPSVSPLLVIGAHYDVASADNPGADDNASGVATLLEMARLIRAARPELAHRLNLVAFTLEEPPHFKTPSMGSYVNARGVMSSKAPLKLMISVEMVGYFSDEPGSQHYPAGILDWLYPDTGDFIGVVGRTLDREPVARVKALMASASTVRVHSINAPVALAGIDFSDNWSFWEHGLPAVMVTDTAFYRNPNYHRPTDTPGTLDYRRLAGVVDGLYQVALRY